MNWDELATYRRVCFFRRGVLWPQERVAIPIHTSDQYYIMCFASGYDGIVTPEVQSHLNGLAFMAFQNWYRACVPSPLDYGLSQKTLLILKMMGTEETTTQIGRRIGMTKDGVAGTLKPRVEN